MPPSPKPTPQPLTTTEGKQTKPLPKARPDRGRKQHVDGDWVMVDAAKQGRGPGAGGASRPPGAEEEHTGEKKRAKCYKCGWDAKWGKMYSESLPPHPDQLEEWQRVEGTAAEVDYLRKHGQPPRHTFMHLCSACYAWKYNMEEHEAATAISRMHHSEKHLKRAANFKKAMALEKTDFWALWNGSALDTPGEFENSGTKSSGTPPPRFVAKNVGEALQNPGSLVGDHAPVADLRVMRTGTCHPRRMSGTA